tara:strand:- start:1272 stop:1568 length:297 start_codon:yes stop_codon:yes gene_type:complete
MTKKKEEQNKPVEKEFRFSGSPARLDGEDFEEYKARRKMLKALEKQKLKGKIIWHSKILGKYLKEFKGREHEIYEKLREYQRNQQDKMDSDDNSESEV